ncbi:MAG: AbrB/MazE/SpoVT family DNA-binding domain-containing protein [Candidatus Brockarchaeota archaeon]|nr:AbrB/MazE/SpoVT family DNA-binding domain-containing protein [Candidatus Brockarchaeota archaeon]
METRVGKKYAIYLPKAVAKAVGLKEGDRVMLRVTEESIILEVIRDPIELALTGKKFASVKPEEIEAISIEEQAKNTA